MKLIKSNINFLIQFSDVMMPVWLVMVAVKFDTRYIYSKGFSVYTIAFMPNNHARYRRRHDKGRLIRRHYCRLMFRFWSIIIC